VKSDSAVGKIGAGTGSGSGVVATGHSNTEIVYGKHHPEISYSTEHDILTVNGHKISREFLEQITTSPPGIRFRIVERSPDSVITISQERSKLEAAAQDMLEALTNIILNSRIQPDASMNGAADCYAVALDDMQAAIAACEKARG